LVDHEVWFLYESPAGLAEAVNSDLLHGLSALNRINNKILRKYVDVGLFKHWPGFDFRIKGNRARNKKWWRATDSLE
jgi:hypothetical protein